MAKYATELEQRGQWRGRNVLQGDLFFSSSSRNFSCRPENDLLCQKEVRIKS